MQCRPPDRPRARPPARSHAGIVTDDDRRQTTDVSEQNNTSPFVLLKWRIKRLIRRASNKLYAHVYILVDVCARVYNYIHHFCVVHGRGSKYCDHRVCMSVCLSLCLSVCMSARIGYLKHHTSNIDEIFSACYLWPWLGPLQITLCTSGFVDDVMFLHNRANWPE